MSELLLSCELLLLLLLCLSFDGQACLVDLTTSGTMRRLLSNVGRCCLVIRTPRSFLLPRTVAFVDAWESRWENRSTSGLTFRKVSFFFLREYQWPTIIRHAKKDPTERVMSPKDDFSIVEKRQFNGILFPYVHRIWTYEPLVVATPVVLQQPSFSQMLH